MECARPQNYQNDVLQPPKIFAPLSCAHCGIKRRNQLIKGLLYVIVKGISENMAIQRVGEGFQHRFLLRALSSRVAGFCLFGTAYYLAYFFGMSFSKACASPFWFPDVILLGALLLTRPRDWFWFILWALVIRLIAPVSEGVPTGFLLITLAIDSAKGLAAATLLRTFMRNPLRLATVKEFGVFILIAALLVPAASSFVAAAPWRTMGSSYWTAWEQWFMGDALAQLVLMPGLLHLVSARWEMKWPPGKNSLEAAFLVAGLIVTNWLAFATSIDAVGLLETRYYFPVPLMFWAAIRFGMPGASIGVVITTIVSVDAAVHGHGSFQGLSASETALLLQQFLLLRAVPLYLVAILIQQKENAEHFLRESEQRFRNMANTAPALIWMSGTDKLCDFFNLNWLEFTGRTMEQELGNGWAEGVHPDDFRRCVDVYYSSFDARVPFEMEYRLRRRDGEYRWVLDRGIPRYAAGGEFVGYVGMAIDLTDRKRAEEARRDLMHASRLVVLGEFTAMVAHELNQPLSTILVNVDAMNVLLDMQTMPMTEARQIMEDIRRDNSRATEAIRHLRALACKREMEMLPLNINETISGVIRLAEGDALRRGVQVVEEYGDDVPMIRGDVIHLQQVVLNLILNGMDAMKDCPIVERRLLVRTVCNDRDLVEVSVRDSGHGIPATNLLRVFESFFTTKQNGIGLGLSISRSIIQLHAGRLWAENNTNGRGTTFRFTVPPIVKTSAQIAPCAKAMECRAEQELTASVIQPLAARNQ